jgi:magnesium chelatase family protein
VSFSVNGSRRRSTPRVIPLERLEQLQLLGTDDEPPPSRAPDLGGARADPALPDLADLRGQPYLRFALEVAAAGGHGLLVTGPPGAGKSLAAKRLPSILPPLTDSEAIEVLRIASATGRRVDWEAFGARPFRAPHHTTSSAGLVGGGSPPRPGEVTLAHRGVLFLDELPEFSRDALEALRQPMEDGRVTITRARHSVELPSRFMLVAAANPCPCGNGPASGECECTPGAVRRYTARLSGALADRVDICLRVEQPHAEVMRGPPGESSDDVRRRVAAARERQERRLGPGRCNAEMTPAELRRKVRLESSAERALASGHERLRLSGRGYDRVLRLARTLADLDASPRVTPGHVTEALALRRPSELR